VHPRTIALLGEGALTVSGLAVGIGFAVARSRAAHRITVLQTDVDTILPTVGASACGMPNRPVQCADLERAIDDHQRATALMTIGFVGAGVGLTAGVLTYVLWPGAAAEVSVALRPEGARILVGGAF
jgi:hypothetical protein